MANVGDSSALLCSSHPCMNGPANLTYLLDSAAMQIQSSEPSPSTNNYHTDHMDDCSSSSSSYSGGSISGINSTTISSIGSSISIGSAVSSLITNKITKSNMEHVVSTKPRKFLI